MSLNILSTIVFLSHLDQCQVIITDDWRSQDINIPKIQWWAYYHINWSTEGYRRHWVENVDVHLRNRQNGWNTLRQTNPTDDTDLNWISKQTGVSIKLCGVWNLQNFIWNFLENRSWGKERLCISIWLSNRIQTGQLSILHPSIIHQSSNGKIPMTWQIIENVENKYQWYIHVYNQDVPTHTALQLHKTPLCLF